MNIKPLKFVTSLLVALHRNIQVFITTLFLALVFYVASLFWVTGTSPFLLLDFLLLPFQQAPPSIERQFDYDAEPVAFSQTLDVSQSTRAEHLTQTERMQRMVRSVVHVTVKTGGSRNAVGSGVILDNRRCLVATNAHVIDDDGQIVVKLVERVLHNGEEVLRDVPAAIVGRPAVREDLALLQLAECANMPWAYWLDMAAPARGTQTIAIGHPNSQTWTSTKGSVSHPARFWPKRTTTGFGLIQTDAAINPGNSGGGLFDGAGRLVGINSMILRRSNNLGYARSTAALNNYINHLRNNGEMAERALPFKFAPLRTPDGHFGLLVGDVPDTLVAVNDTLQSGDVIIGTNGRALLTENSMRRAMWSEVDGVLDLNVLRDDELITVTVNLIASAANS